MPYVKRIVCLANSLKVGGSCIAGRELLTDGRYGGWIRPVSVRPTAEISFMESLCDDNTDPRLLDILDIPLTKPLPHLHQTENHEIDTTRPWVRSGQLTVEDLCKLVQHPTALWLNTGRTYGGSFDCMSREEAATFSKSLVMIHVPALKIEVRTRVRDRHARPCYRANFKYKETYHSLSLTDPTAIHAVARRGDGLYPLPASHLCISLTQPLARDNGRCHKVVASVIACARL